MLQTMTTKDLIVENLDQLSEDTWSEVLNFVMFLRYKEEQTGDAIDLADAQAALAEQGFIPLAEVLRL
jgi:hypothetical protein